MLEASTGGDDGEGPVAVRQISSEQRGLAEPRTHFSSFSNTVGH